MVAVPTATPVTANEPVVAPAATVTGEGATVATPVSELTKVTCRPPAGAAALSVIVPPIDCPIPVRAPTKVRVIVGVETAIATGDGLLSTCPSLQINCS